MQANSLAEALERPEDVIHLVISGQELERVPAKIWKKLPALESLDLSHNRIKKLPAGLGQLTRLRRLELSHNRITRIESDFFTLFPKLKHLDLSHNRLRQLHVVALDLESLEVSSNRLQGIAPLQLHCPSLLHLNLDDNKLEEFTVASDNVVQLHYLSLGRNKLRKLPALPTSLYALVANNNRLSALPPNWTDLHQLQRLEIAYNPVQLTLPELAWHPQLSYVDVRHTPTHWPGVEALLLKLPQLRYLHGGLSRKLQDQLNGFLSETPPTSDANQRALSFRLWQGFAAGQVPSNILWSCLSAALHPLIRQGAHYELLRKYPARTGQLRSRTWWLQGDMASPMESIQQRLDKAGIDWTENPKLATGVLLGHRFARTPAFPISELPIMEERQLIHWLDRREKRFLTHSNDIVELANLKRMLRASDAGSFTFGIEMLRSQGTPDNMIPVLLERWQRTPAAERQSWEDVLLPYLPGSLNIALEERKRLLTLPSRRGKVGSWWKLLER